MIKNLLRINNYFIRNSFTIKRFCTELPKQTETTAEVLPKEEKEEPKDNSIIVEQNGQITLIGINRPNVRNCIDVSTGRKLTEAIEKFEDDENSTVGVLYGVGGSFCAGYDLSELAKDDVTPEKLVFEPEGVMGPTRRKLKKTMICAVTGFCVAGGLELALMCDLRVMEESSIMGLLNRRFGVPLVDGGSVRLPAIIGLSRALDLVLTGRQVAAKEALEMGLVNRVVATGTAVGQSLNLALSIAKFPQLCVKHDRDAVYYSMLESKSFNDAIQYELMTANKELLDEARNGATKFKSGVGRGGKSWDIKEKVLPDWEKEEIEIEKQYRNKNK